MCTLACEGLWMDGAPILEIIASDLEVLMERFIDNSTRDLDAMWSALDSGDLPTLIRLGHTAKGTGYGYGMRGMGDIGLAIEAAAREGAVDRCREEIDRMAHYLANVTIEYE